MTTTAQTIATDANTRRAGSLGNGTTNVDGIATSTKVRAYNTNGEFLGYDTPDTRPIGINDALRITSTDRIEVVQSYIDIDPAIIAAALDALANGATVADAQAAADAVAETIRQARIEAEAVATAAARAARGGGRPRRQRTRGQ